MIFNVLKDQEDQKDQKVTNVDEFPEPYYYLLIF